MSQWDSVSTVAPQGQQPEDKWSKVAAPIPEFWDRVPNPASLAPGLPSFLGGKPKKAPPNQWDLPPEALQGLLNAGLTSMDDEQLIDIIKKNVPDAEFMDGGEGKVIVNIQGKPAYLNAPGFSAQDFVRGTTGASYVATAATPAGMATRGLPLAVRALTVGGASAAGSAAQDVAAHTQGAEKIVDVPRAAVAGAAGVVGEAVLAPAISAAYRFITTGGARGLYNRATGSLTAAGKQMLQRAGAKADEISDALAQRFAGEAATSSTAGQALRYSEAQTLPVPVTLTRGQISQSPRQQMLESSLYKGDYGDQASNIMRSAEAAQQGQLRGNLPTIQEQIAMTPQPVGQPGFPNALQSTRSGAVGLPAPAQEGFPAPLGGGRLAPTVIDRGQGGAVSQQALMKQRARLETKVNEGYDAARKTTGGFAVGAVDDLGANMSKDLSFNYVAGTVPKADAVLQDFGKLSMAARGGFMGGQELSGDASVMIRSMFDWRARATKAMMGASDKAEAGAIKGMIRKFDDWIENSVDDAIFAGNPEAIETWKQAIASRRELGAKFEGGDLIEALTTMEPRSGRMALAVSPEDASNYIFGASETGWITKSNLARDLIKLRERLGADSLAWNTIRQEAFLRFARAGEGAQQGGTRLWSGAKFSKAWEEANRNGNPVMNILFTPHEKNLISQFARVGNLATSPVKGGANFSNSSHAVINYIKTLGGSLGQTAARYIAMIGPGRAFNMVRAGNAVTGAPATMVRGSGTGGAITATGANLYQQEKY